MNDNADKHIKESLHKSSLKSLILSIKKKFKISGIANANIGGKLFIYFNNEKIVTGKALSESQNMSRDKGCVRFFIKFVSVK